MNDYQKRRFAENIISTLYNTISGKKIAFLGWAFKKDTNDTRETAAMYVASILMEDNAEIHVYDPKVTEQQILSDLEYLSMTLQHSITSKQIKEQLHVHYDPYLATQNAHAIALLTEWDEFKTYDWQRIYDEMKKPAFIFDGRNLLKKSELDRIGFKVNQIGKTIAN